MEMLVGVAATSVAVPPAIESAKSSLSIDPLPLPVPKAFSLSVTVTVELSFARTVLVIFGPLLSFKFPDPLT